MKLTTPFTALRNATSDIWKMHHFNYQLTKDIKQDYWDTECRENPTNQNCLIYCDWEILEWLKSISGDFSILPDALHKYDNSWGPHVNFCVMVCLNLLI